MEGPTPTAAEISAHSTDPTWDRWFFGINGIVQHSK